MSNRLLLVFFAALILILLVYFLTSEKSSNAAQPAYPDSEAGLSQLAAPAPTVSTSDQPVQQQSTSSTDGFDTKSDFSIQPINPETDPANQVSKP